MSETVTVTIGDVVVEYNPATRVFRMMGPALIVEGQLAEPPTRFNPDAGNGVGGASMPAETAAAVQMLDLITATLGALAKIPGISKKDKELVEELEPWPPTSRTCSIPASGTSSEQVTA
jgi:hypothetical protein